jgi:hypothetical protein
MVKLPLVQFDFVQASQWASDKLDYLASIGAITNNQCSMTKKYLPYCEVEDLLLFKLGYKGFITECFDNQ